MRRPPDTLARISRLFLAGVMVLVGAPQTAAAASTTCPAFGAKEKVATYWKSGLKEVSGLQSSLEHPGVMWAVQDSGNGPHLYALDVAGHVLVNYTLSGTNVSNVDWEAIALDPRNNAPDYIYIGDVGDNAHNRNGISRQVPALYRLREPKVSATWFGQTRLATISTGISKFPFRYYSAGFVWRLQPRNTEAMFVDPRSHAVVIIQKDLTSVNSMSKQARVFQLPESGLSTSKLNKAEAIGSITGASPGVQVGPVAADISADGRWIVVKNYAEGFLWRRGWKERISTTFADAPTAPCSVPVDNAEAIAFEYSSGAWNGFLSLREARRTGAPPLDRYPRQ